MTGAVFVMAISAYYMLRRQDVPFARSSFRLAAIFGMVATLMTIQMGDESGYLVTKNQPTKIAAMEAIWETHKAPAPLTLFAIPDEAARTNHLQIDLPWLFGLMGTRSLSTEIPGINELTAQSEQRIIKGQQAFRALEQLRKEPANEMLRSQFMAVRDDLGFGLLLKRYTNDVTSATPEMIKQAAADTIPSVAPMFWSFRLMVGSGLAMALVFILGLFFTFNNEIVNKKWYLRLAMLSLPLPWIASEAGWFVAEFGRQPWTIYNVLPTHLSVSALSASDVASSLLGFGALYTALLIVEMWLMIRISKRGPSALGTGRYHFEHN